MMSEPLGLGLGYLGFFVIGSIFTGWWFGIFFIFPYIGKNHPN